MGIRHRNDQGRYSGVYDEPLRALDRVVNIQLPGEQPITQPTKETLPRAQRAARYIVRIGQKVGEHFHQVRQDIHDVTEARKTPDHSPDLYIVRDPDEPNPPSGDN